MSSMPREVPFIHRVQADTMWVHVPGQRRQVPVLMICDSATRLLAARLLLGGEKTEEFIKQLERAWIRNFSPMMICAPRMALSCRLALGSLIPGLPSWRGGIRSPEEPFPCLWSRTLRGHPNPSWASEPDGLTTALNYVIPQINRTPNISGYNSPIQWTLGYTPHVPGLLMEEPTGTTQLRWPPPSSSWRSFDCSRKLPKP